MFHNHVDNNPIICRSISLNGVRPRKGNQTLAFHCALIAGCMNIIFAQSLRSGSQLLNDMFFVIPGKDKIVGRNHIFSPLCLIKAVI